MIVCENSCMCHSMGQTRRVIILTQPDRESPTSSVTLLQISLGPQRISIKPIKTLTPMRLVVRPRNESIRMQPVDTLQHPSIHPTTTLSKQIIHTRAISLTSSSYTLAV
jgi:hypothetical protein